MKESDISRARVAAVLCLILAAYAGLMIATASRAYIDFGDGNYLYISSRLADGLVLYRSHSGMTLEDKMLNSSKEDWERELFVPICSGVTIFKINAIQGEELLDKWNEALPTGIKITLSFAEPVEKADGSLDVPDEEKTIRTIAIDRTRKITFEISGAASLEQKDESTPKEPTDDEKTLTGNDDQTTSDNNSKRTLRSKTKKQQKTK